jgi:hypothetical protein
MGNLIRFVVQTLISNVSHFIEKIQLNLNSLFFLLRLNS